MKALYRISLLINCIGLAFLLVKGGEVLTKKWSWEEYTGPEQVYAAPEPTKKPLGAAIESSSESGTQAEKDVSDPEAAAKTVSNDEQTTSCDTVCHVLKSNLTAGTEEETVSDIPPAYIGKTRAQLAELIDLYNQKPPLEEQKEGFVGMELISFSRSDLTIRKTYETNQFYCCVVVEDDFLTVYDEARENVILYTDIPLEGLPGELAQEIIDGKYMKTQQQLYDFLESYSS